MSTELSPVIFYFGELIVFISISLLFWTSLTDPGIIPRGISPQKITKSWKVKAHSSSSRFQPQPVFDTSEKQQQQRASCSTEATMVPEMSICKTTTLLPLQRVWHMHTYGNFTRHETGGNMVIEHLWILHRPSRHASSCRRTLCWHPEFPAIFSFQCCFLCSRVLYPNCVYYISSEA